MQLELTVTAKGQVTLRQSVLDHLKVRPGEKISVSLLPDGKVELHQAGADQPISRLRGCLMRLGQRPVTLEEMQDAIESVDP